MKIHLNLANRVYINRRGLYAAYLIALLALAVLLVFNATFLLRNWTQIESLEQQLLAVERQLGVDTEAEADQINPAAYENLVEEIEAANAILLRDGFRWIDLLNRLENVMVPGVSVRRIQPRPQENQLDLTVVAQDLESMQNFLDRLIESASFQEVYLMRQEQAEIEDSDGRKRQAIRLSLSLQGVF